MNIEIVKVNEFESLAKGLDYLNKNKPEFAFMFSKKSGKINCSSMVFLKLPPYSTFNLEKRRLSVPSSQYRFRG